MTRILVIDSRDTIAELIAARLRESPGVESCNRAPQLEDGFGGELTHGYAAVLRDCEIDTVVYAPSLCSPRSLCPELADAEAVFQQCADAAIKKLVLLSSAVVYGASPHNPGLISESRRLSRNGKNPIGGPWADLEATASIYLGGHQGTKLTILRPVAVLDPGSDDFLSRLFNHRLAITLAGHDPSIQLLNPQDLATAVCLAVESPQDGIYNVSPDGVIPLRKALRLTGSTRVPLPRWMQRISRAALAPVGLAHSVDQLEFIRYSWTVSNKKIKKELGFTPSQSSAEALASLGGAETAYSKSSEIGNRDFDDFGMDRDYVEAYGRTLFKLLERYYWRIEVSGIERVPRSGRAVLVGMHRGFMPFDGVMALHQLTQKVGRCPRFLIHPTLIKFPFLFNFMTKLGGIIACQENADYVLERDEILGIFPEGIHGAFALYKDAYHLGKLGRDEFVKMALRNRAPIIPFVTVGSAEIFPIFKKLEWRWWKRYTEWPCLPLTPTFPFLPIPLPSKWHTQFLTPIHVENVHPAEAADDPAIVRAISAEVKVAMEGAIQKILGRRKSIFYGSVFEQEAN